MGPSTVAAPASISTVQVKLDFKNYDEKRFQPFMAKVLKCSDGNTFLTPPEPIMQNCILANSNYIAARTNRDANPSTSNSQFLEVAQVKGGEAFEMLAVWIQDNCNNDAAIVLSFGFKVSKTTRTAATRTPVPKDVVYEYGMPGTIKFKCKSLGVRVRYIVECSSDGGLTWQICGVSTKSFEIIAKGLARGKEYIFRLYGSNAAGDGFPWTSGSIIAAV